MDLLVSASDGVDRPARRLYRSPWFWLWLAGSSVTVTTIQAGQWSAALGCAAAAAWWAARRGAWGACGAWLGLVGAFKPFAAPVALWVLLDGTRARRAALPMVVGAAIPFVLGVAVFGVDAHRAWLEQAKDVQWLWTPWSASVHGLLARAGSEGPFAPVSTVPGPVSALGWLLAAAILAASLWRARTADPDRAFALLWISSLLAFPLGWVYYGWLAFAPVYSLFEAGRLRQPLAVLALGLLAFPPLVLMAGEGRLWAATGGSMYFWATALLFAAVWIDRTGEGAR
jgi:hypothetical protein